jgi:hypothetical protein
MVHRSLISPVVFSTSVIAPMSPKEHWEQRGHRKQRLRARLCISLILNYDRHLRELARPWDKRVVPAFVGREVSGTVIAWSREADIWRVGRVGVCTSQSV